MFEIVKNDGLPDVAQAEIKALVTEKLPAIDASLHAITDQATIAERSDVPSEIVQAQKAAIQIAHQFELKCKEVATQVPVLSSAYVIKHREEKQPHIDKLKEELKNEQEAPASLGFIHLFGAVATLGFMNIVVTGMQAAYEAGKKLEEGDDYRLPWTRRDEEMARLNRAIPAAEATLNQIVTRSNADVRNAEIAFARRMFFPSIYSLKAAHGQRNYHEADRVATDHQTTPDAIMRHLQQANPECAKSFLALLKAEYQIEDLLTLSEYAATAEITESPEQRAFLQFVNHSLIPHMDYFEVWASKMHDFAVALPDINQAFKANQLSQRPKLEVLGETAITLSGQRSVARAAIAPSTSIEKQALDDGKKYRDKARENVTSLIAKLRDSAQGYIKTRHTAVREETLAHIQDFTRFFGGIEAALKDFDAKLGQMESKRDKAWSQFVNAEAISNQIELAKFNSPESMRDYNRKVLWMGVAGRTIFGDISFAGELAHGEVSNHQGYQRSIEENKIKMKSLLRRMRGNPDELEATFKKLEDEINRLSENKEFTAFLQDSGAVQDVQSIYLLLPRLAAGESNIDALEARVKKAGYEKIDDFVAELREGSPRLAQAMENSLYGLANSNDLKVLIAEANAIHDPQTPKEKVLMAYVEKTIKQYYRDQSKQAAIVDQLEMRNALYTGHPFHSFSEIVKVETDSALRALMSGQGDFSLVGSGDVHQMFGYYQDRHGEDFFVDLLDNTKLVDRTKRAKKAPHVMDQEEIRTIGADVAYARNANTLIPRISSIFTEVCAYEYLLSQGANIMKDRRLMHTPQSLGAFEMVNQTTNLFMQKLAMYDARKHKGGDKPVFLGSRVENLIAQSFVDFYSELGAAHREDPTIREKSARLNATYTAENFPQASGLYSEAITESGNESFELFLNVYRHNLEKYLEVATRENKQELLDQLDEVKGIMKDIQVSDSILPPDSEEARLRAHYRNHSLSNAGLSHSTWVMRTESILGNDSVSKNKS